MGVWSHPEISLEELLKLIKGFVDILILASGYQSSGHFAHWDPLNIKKAFQWGLFFENVLKSIDDNQDSVNELDAAVSELTSNPHFPQQGLTHLSSVTLSKARYFILEHLIRTLPMRDSHIKAVLKATIDMDLEELQKTEINYLDVYIDKLKLQNEEGIMDFSPIPCPDDNLHVKVENDIKVDLTTFAIQGIKKRLLAVSHVSSIETSVNVLAKTITQVNSNDGLLHEEQNHPTAYVWNHWRTRTLSYLLDKRTIRLVSGARMIFSAPKVQWAQVFEQLDISKEGNTNFCETIELLLLGCISTRWDRIIQRFMSNSHEQPLGISTLYEGVHKLLLERFQNVDSMQQKQHSKKEQEIMEYLEVKLSNQIHHLWELSPALVAASLPPWSRLFEVYASELLSQFKGKTTKIRCCGCIDDNKEHIECEVVERIWCVYVFHVSKKQVVL
ncbi:putative fanconi anemia group F protein [Helianthus annuus]|uniref:Fanconi anemia group F protein n=1 Tax=Helianthus annuus TaxID=4232 RepID=A0A9K3J826_HELAN|nr:putative fanconi anemia group F protein [Helianthus annuus]KAJ0589232.1 putative fanconi anemia group F protein [Helianthus annuus]KAJ0931604.1 putative fanconi anemia group F protein [Helianthus annuus]